MDIIKYVIFAFILLISLIQSINPRILWRASRWQFKNPDANEPSQAAFMVQRIVGIVIFLGVAVLVITQLRS